ncbi:MAG: hypothetical protein IKS71_06830 [Bacteroidales bacterium]|nr:hypothetical protein [Bacteroidales bacterium]
MSKTWIKTLIALAVTFLLSSCWFKNGNSSSDVIPEVKGFELLSYVPSDACGVIVCEKAAAGLENLFDSGNVFRELTYGRLADSKMVISYHFVGELIPMIAVDAGRSQADAKQAAEIIEAAAELELEARIVQKPGKSGRKSVLLISPSAPILDAAERHMEAHTSVLEVVGLTAALEKAPARGDVVIFRNDAIANLLPKDFLSKYLGRKQIVGFIKGYSEWTVMHLEGTETAGKGVYLTYDVRTVHPDDFSKSAQVFESQGYGESKVANMLPQGTTYVIDQPVANIDNLLEARKKNLDARGGLKTYSNTCAKLSKNTGVDPEKWAAEIDIKEVAKVQWKNEEVILVRPAKPLVSHNIRFNQHRGFISTLFGQGYSIADDSHSACIGNWLVMGSENAVKHFLAAEVKQKLHYWPSKNVRAIVLADDCQLTWTRSELRFDVYRTY